MPDNDLIRRGDVLAKTSPAVFDGQAVDVVYVSDVAKIPTVDAVEVVRCKDCKCFETKKNAPRAMCDIWECATNATDFCSCGERR